MASHHPIDDIMDDLYGNHSIPTNRGLPFSSSSSSSSSTSTNLLSSLPYLSNHTNANNGTNNNTNPTENPSSTPVSVPPSSRNPSHRGERTVSLPPPPSSSYSSSYVANPHDIFQNSQRIQTMKQATKKTILNALLPHERLALTREERTRALWEQRSKEWSNFRTTIAKKLHRTEDELVSTHAEEFRAQREELDIIDRAKAQIKETDGADGWRSGLRSGGTRYILVGNPFTGLWCPVKESSNETKLMETVRKPRSLRTNEHGKSRTLSPQPTSSHQVQHPNNNNTAASSDSDSEDDEHAPRKSVPIQVRRSSSAWRQAPELLRKKAAYADHINNMRPHEIDENVAAGLIVKGEHLLEWALRGSLHPKIKDNGINGIGSMETILSGADSNNNDNVSPGPSVHQLSSSSQLIPSQGAAGRHSSSRHQNLADGLGGLRPSFGAKNSVQDLQTAEEHNSAIMALQLDRARSALIAGNKWKGEKLSTLTSSSIGSVQSMDSFGSSAITPEGSVTSGTAVNILRSAIELVPGPHMHIQIISDAATGTEDIGAAIGLTGRLPPVRGALANRNPAIAAVALSLGDETGLISTLTGTVLPNSSNPNLLLPHHPHPNDTLTGPTAVPRPESASQPTLVDFHPSWTNSIVLGRTQNDGQIVNMGTTKVGESAGYTNPEFLQTITRGTNASSSPVFNSTSILSAIQNINSSRTWPHVALECSVGNTSFAKVRISNVGTTVLYYSWTAANQDNGTAGGTHLHATAPLDMYNTKNTNDMFQGTTNSLVSDQTTLANAPVPYNPRFLCARMAGSVIPGGNVDIIFTFTAEKPGIYNETWILHTSPSTNEGQNVRIGLRGVANLPDETGPRRQRLENRLRDAAAYGIVQDVLNQIIDTIEFIPPPPPSKESISEHQSKIFLRYNPGLYYSDTVYEGLNQVAQETYAALNYAPQDRHWDGSITSLAGVIQQLIPTPETSEEKTVREQMEAKAYEEAKARAEAEAKARAEAEAAAAEAAALASANAKGGKKPSGPVATAKSASPSASAKRPGTSSGERPPSSQDTAPLPSSTAIILPPLPSVEGPAQVRQRKMNELRNGLNQRLTNLTVQASQRPLEQSPIYQLTRSFVCDLLDTLPFIAGGVREAVKQEFIEHVVPKDIPSSPTSASSSSTENSLPVIGSPRKGETSWVDLRPNDDEHKDILYTLYGKKGRPAPYVRRTRQKLGRDGQYHEVFIDPEETEDNQIEDGDEDEDEILDTNGDNEPLDPLDISARETFGMFNRRVMSQYHAAQAAQEAQLKAAIEAAAVAEAQAKAAAEAAAAHAAAEAEAAKKGGKKPPVPTPSPTPVAVVPVPVVPVPVAHPIDHPLASLLPTVPNSDSSDYKYYSRFAFATKRAIQQCLSKFGAATVDFRTKKQETMRAKTLMNLDRKLALPNVMVENLIALVRADYDTVPNILLRQAANTVEQLRIHGDASTASVSQESILTLSTERHVLASLPTINDLVQRKAKLIILSAAQGQARLPYPEDKRPVYQPTADTSDSLAGVLTFSEAYETVLSHSALQPLPDQPTQASVTAQEDKEELENIAREEYEKEKARKEAERKARKEQALAEYRKKYPYPRRIRYHDEQKDEELELEMIEHMDEEGYDIHDTKHVTEDDHATIPSSDRLNDSRDIEASEDHLGLSSSSSSSSTTDHFPLPSSDNHINHDLTKSNPVHPSSFSSSSSSAGSTATSAVTRTYASSTFTGLAAALSLLIGNDIPVIFVRLTSYAHPRVWMNGQEYRLPSSSSPVDSTDERNTSSRLPYVSSEFARVFTTVASSAADFAEFTRKFANDPSSPAQSIILLENFFHPDTYASEVGSRRLYSFTRRRRHLPLSIGHPQLDEVNVHQWMNRHVGLWVQLLCPGIENQDTWRTYIDNFAKHQITGEELLRWCQGRIPEPVPVVAPSPSESVHPVEPTMTTASRPPTSNGPATTVTKPGSAKPGSAKPQPHPSTVPTSPAPAPVPLPLQPTVPLVETLPSHPLTLAERIGKHLTTFGIENIHHIAIFLSALSRLQARSEMETAAMQREESMNLWAEQQASTATAAMLEGMERVTATLRIQALMRGYVARRRAALARGRQLEAHRRRAYATDTEASKYGKKGSSSSRTTKNAVGADQLRLISGAPAENSIDKVPKTNDIKGAADPSLNLGLDTGSFMDGGNGQSNAHAGAAVRFAAFSTELTAHAFISRATRTQAAVRAILSNCCDLFVADSLCAAINETASSTGVRPARATISYRLQTAINGNVSPSAYVREHGPVIFTRIAHIRGRGASEERRLAKKKALQQKNSTMSENNDTIPSPVAGTNATVEESAAIEIQRILRGRAARKQVNTIREARRPAVSSSQSAATPTGNPTTNQKSSNSSTALSTNPTGTLSSSSNVLPGYGLRVLGLNIRNEVQSLGALLQEHTHPTTGEKLIQGPVVSIIGGGADLRAKLAAFKRLIYVSHTIVLTGLIGWTWVAYITLPSIDKSMIYNLDTILGATTARCSYFHQAGSELRTLANLANRLGVRIISPVDGVVAAEPFDIRSCNPLPFNGIDPEYERNLPSTIKAVMNASSTVPHPLAIQHQVHVKGVPGEEIEEIVDPEDEIPDEDYDSDNSVDMERLRQRNQRRETKRQTEATVRAQRRAKEQERIAARSGLPEEFDPAFKPSVMLSSGIHVPLPANPRHQNYMELPDSESSSYEWMWERSTRTIDIQSMLINPLESNEAFIDIGPNTSELITEECHRASTILLYGPTGVVEVPEGSTTTQEFVGMLAQNYEQKTTFLVGGSLLAYVRRLGYNLSTQFTTVSEMGTVLLCNTVVPGLALISEKE